LITEAFAAAAESRQDAAPTAKNGVLD